MISDRARSLGFGGIWEAAKLKAYLKNKYREEDALVDEVIAGPAAAVVSALDGTKIRYRDSRPI